MDYQVCKAHLGRSVGPEEMLRGFPMARGKMLARNTMSVIRSVVETVCGATSASCSTPVETSLTSLPYVVLENTLSKMLRGNAVAVRVRKGDMMSGFYTLSRVLVAFFGFTMLLGILWFSGSLSRTIIFAGLLMGFSSLAASFVSQSKLSSGTTRRNLVALCVVGISTGLVLVADNLSASRSIEWDVVSMNIVHISALVAIAIMALKQKKEK